MTTTKATPAFNERGYRIPPPELQAKTTKPYLFYSLLIPPVSPLMQTERIRWQYQYLSGTRLRNLPEIKYRLNAVVRKIRSHRETAGILNGVALPFVLPRIHVHDYGHVLEEIYLPQVAEALDAIGWTFKNELGKDLVDQFAIAPHSRYTKLIDALSRKSVVGLYFPSCLQGFNDDADHEQLNFLPDHFMLAGALEAAACMIGYPEILARDNKTPLLKLAALTYGTEKCIPNFRTRSPVRNCVTMGSYRSDPEPKGSYAAGLVVIG